MKTEPSGLIPRNLL